MKTSDFGISFIIGWEGKILHLYNDPVGHCTVGIGHLVHFGNCDGRSSEQPYSGGITHEQALSLFKSDLLAFERAVENIGVRFNQNQFDALVDFSYNTGQYVFDFTTNGRILRDHLRTGRFDLVCQDLLRFVYAGEPPQYLDALRRRRESECQLFWRQADPLQEAAMALSVSWVTAGVYGRDPTYLTMVCPTSPHFRRVHIKNAAQEQALRSAGHIGAPATLKKVTSQQLAEFTEV